MSFAAGATPQSRAWDCFWALCVIATSWHPSRARRDDCPMGQQRADMSLATSVGDAAGSLIRPRRRRRAARTAGHTARYARRRYHRSRWLSVAAQVEAE